jgi:hypothetical protein
MKKYLIGSTFLFSFFLAACDDSSDVSTKEQTDSPAKHHFIEFSLDVDYLNKENYDAEYDQENDKLEASIEDDRNQENLNGNAAYERLNPLLEKLTFDATTPDDQVIAEVLKVFSLDDNYTEFDLEVTFHDGTRAEYKQTKQ